MKIYNLLYFIIALSSNLIFGQQEVYHHFSRNDQLPDATFYDIIEDDHFNIWLAADSGLYKYNGKQFILYTHPDQHGDAVFNLTLDHKGRLWFNNIYGQFFYVENEQMTLFYDAHDLVKGQLVPFTINDDSVMLYTWYSGTYRVSLTDKTVVKKKQDLVLSMRRNGQNIWHLDIPNDKSGANRHKIVKDIKGKSTVITQFYENGIVAPQLFIVDDRVLLLYKLGGINKLFAIYDNGSMKAVSLPKNLEQISIYNIVSQEDQKWLCTSDGAWLFQLNDTKLEIQKHTLESQSVTNVINDFNSNIWATTLDNGIFVIPNKDIKRLYLPGEKQKINAVCQLDDGRFVIGTNDGVLYIYDSDLQISRTIKLNNRGAVNYLYFDSQTSSLLVSTTNNSSYKLDVRTFQLIRYDNILNSAKSILRVNDSQIFYGSFKEALLYDNSLERSQAVLIRKQRVKGAMLLSGDRLLISFVDGVYVYHVRQKVLKEIKHEGESVFATSIGIHENDIWLGTKGASFLLLNREDDKLRFRESITISDFNTLKENSSSFVKLQSDENDLWMLNCGVLTLYEPIKRTTQQVNGQLGINDLITDFIIGDEVLTAFSSRSIYQIPKDVLKSNFKTAPITITEVTVNETPRSLRALSKLDHDENNINFTFNSNGFKASEYVEYQYQINNEEGSWRRVPYGTTQLQFASLSPGDYSFKLRGKNNRSTGYKYLKPVRFTILPPFWQSYWFYALIVLLIIVLTYLIFKRQQEKKNKKRIQEMDKLLMEKKIASLKLENIRSQMNPHFVFNSLNSIQDFIVSNERELASDYLVKFSRLIRKYLDYSQQDEITLGQEIAALKLYLELEKMRFDDELDYSIKIDDTLNIEHIMIPSLLVQPYVENALKHGLMHKPNNRKLMIDCGVIENKKILSIKIEDNGIGRQQSALLNRNRGRSHTSFSTAVNNERASLYKEQFNKPVDIVIEDLVNDGQASGTRVTITLPLN